MFKFPVKIMVSGHFDPFHDGHLAYLKQAIALGGSLICVVSSDAQLMRKKGKVNIPQDARQEIMRLICTGLEIRYGIAAITPLNVWDTETTLVAEALRHFKPNIFFRGGDKTLADIPPAEREVCNEFGITIFHATLKKPTHGAGMLL